MTDTTTAGNSPAAAASRALATTPQTAVEVAQDVRLLQLATRDDVERFETIVTIPADYQYAIPIRGVKIPGTNDWDNSRAKVGLLSDAYDYLNRVIGVTFFVPKTVFDQDGNECPNPIHRKDYILLRLGGVWYNPMGQLTAAIEDVEVDFNLIYISKLTDSKSAVPVMEQGRMMWDEAGNPELRVSPEDQLKALRQLTSMRAFGLRYPYTVARTRIMKLATGIRSLPIDQPTDWKIRVVGFRDKMTPDERVASVQNDVQEMFGSRPADEGGQPIVPLSNDEMDEVGEVQTEVGEAQRVLDDDAASATKAPSGPPVAGVATPVVGQLICGFVTGPPLDATGNEVAGADETCLVVLDDEGKHAGPHRSASHRVPQQG